MTFQYVQIRNPKSQIRNSYRLPSLEKEGWQPLRLTGWFVSFLQIRNPQSQIASPIASRAAAAEISAAAKAAPISAASA